MAKDRTPRHRNVETSDSRFRRVVDFTKLAFSCIIPVAIPGHFIPKSSKNMARNIDQDKSIREHILYLLRDGGAHIDIETLIADFPLEAINRMVPKLPYSPWQVLEHMRIAQWDILEFSRNAGHVSPEWPSKYWPPADKIASHDDWQQSVDQFLKDRKEMEDLVEDPATDLFAPIPHGTGQTILREALLVAESMAVMRAACSAASDSSMARNICV